MKLKDFLAEIDFVRHGGDADDYADVIVSINGRAIDVDYVERNMDEDIFVIVPKHRRTMDGHSGG